jgi:hypothetical protein
MLAVNLLLRTAGASGANLQLTGSHNAVEFMSPGVRVAKLTASCDGEVATAVAAYPTTFAPPIGAKDNVTVVLGNVLSTCAGVSDLSLQPCAAHSEMVRFLLIHPPPAHFSGPHACC